MNWYEYSQVLIEKCKKKEIPYHAGFELTPFCNFNCHMCYIHLTKDQARAQGKLLSTNQWICLAKEVKDLGTISMEITGGEAMTRTDFPFLYKSFIELGFLIVLRTNGYLIDDNILRLLTQYKPRKIMVTLYGASDDTYKKCCGIDDGFSVVSNNLLKLKNAGMNVHLSATITTENEKDIALMRKWTEENGFDLSLCGMLFTPIRGAKRSIDHLKVRLPDDAYKLSDEMKAAPRDIPNREFYMNPFWMCRTFGAKFTITWDGKMTMCNSNPSVWRDPFKGGVDQAYHDMYRELKSIRRPKECAGCKYIDLCSVCPSMLYSATGSMEQTCEEMCRMARRKYKNQFFMHRDGLEVDKNTICNEYNEGV